MGGRSKRNGRRGRNKNTKRPPKMPIQALLGPAGNSSSTYGDSTARHAVENDEDHSLKSTPCGEEQRALVEAERKPTESNKIEDQGAPSSERVEDSAQTTSLSTCNSKKKVSFADETCSIPDPPTIECETAKCKPEGKEKEFNLATLFYQQHYTRSSSSEFKLFEFSAGSDLKPESVRKEASDRQV